MKFTNQTILITDPCYIINKGEGITDNDWDFCEYGKKIEVLGLKNFMISSTGVGDSCWNLYSCDDPDTIVEEFKKEIDGVNQVYDVKGVKNLSCLGKEFSADSGQTGVFDLSEVLAYNPFFKDNLPERCYAVVENFTGTIDFEYIITKSIPKGFLMIKGKGTTNFITL